MSESPLLQRPRHRFVAFSAVGVAMVCLPLWQVLRYQQSDLHQLAAERALLDPVAKAVHVQFGLLAHRQVAAQLLRGQPQLEPTRQAVQQGVDEHLLALAQQLSQGVWSSALAESRDLTRDWQALTQKVQARALTAPQSDDAHAVRIEQAVQVVDLVTQGDVFSQTEGSGRSPSSARFAQLVRQLSQLAADGPLWLPAETTAEASPAEQLASAQARVASRLNRLQTLLGAAAASTAGGSDTLSGSGSLALAMAEVSSASNQLLQVLNQHPAQRSGGALAAFNAAQRAQLWAAQQQAHQAQLALFNQALGLHKRSLGQRQHSLQKQQMALWAALALLGATALVLAAGLLRQVLRGTPTPLNPEPRHTAPDAAAAAAWNAPPASTAASPTKAEAQRLFGRLRTERNPAQPERQSSRDASRAEPENTLPPEAG